MPIRVIRLQSRNPVVGLVVLLLVLALVLAIVTAGVTLLAGAAVLGGAAYAVRRLVGGRALPRGRPVDAPAIGRLDPSREVFAADGAGAVANDDTLRRLPPAALGDLP
jgi:hypothetical protein